MDLTSIRLTETVVKGGCAAKLPAGQLREVLGKLTLPRPRELSVGVDTLDDACLWDLGGDTFLVQTLDFFTPIVDDPRDFGAIAAANALSDVYAMGGAPKIALTIMGFPASTQPLGLIEPLMAGAVAKIAEAGACLGGGHTIDDDTLKLGFSVTGFVKKSEAWTNAGAKPGDALILTKGLGTGTLTSALKQKRAQPAWIAGAVASMVLLNDAPSLLRGMRVHAATDVTGFGLAGHARQMAEASGARLVIETARLPVLEGARETLGMEILNRAHRTNADYVRDTAEYVDVDACLRWLTVDPQTSGGLLLAVPADSADAVVASLLPRFPAAQVVGSVTARAPGASAVEFR
jgi:selenide,water dikinase